MIKKKSTSETKVIWPYTPEPSPHLEPSFRSLEDVPVDFAMSGDEPARARPISVSTRREGVMSPGRPTLEDVLANKAPSPYTLAAYTAFLSQQHCLETLEFTMEAEKYAKKFDEATASLSGVPLTTATDEGFELMQDWIRILDVYVKPGAPREINLPAEERDELIEISYHPNLPPPESLDPSKKRMYDLMSDSIFIPFCNSLKTVSYAHTYNAMSDFPDTTDLEPSRLTFDERALHSRMQPRRKRSPPATSVGSFSPSRSPPQTRQTHSSTLSSALGRQGGQRLSTHVSNSSAASESALTDSSGGAESPPAGEQDVMTPPTTPPTSDVGMGSLNYATGASMVPGSKSQRSESGGWKKMGMKIFGAGKKKGSFPGSD